MNYNSAKQAHMEMLLKQVGAQVESLHGILSYVSIDIGDIQLTYEYNINRKDEFFLQRIKPYPLGAGTFNNSLDVLKFIMQDIEQFTNAINSRVFSKFTDVAYKSHRIIHDLEDLFLSFNVPMDRMEKIEEYLKLIDQEIKEVEKTATRISIREKY